MKCFVTKVQLGCIVLDGLMDSKGKYYLSVPQIMSHLTTDTKQPTRAIKALPVKGLTIDKANIVGTRETVNVINAEMLEFILFEFAMKGDKAAKDIVRSLVGLSIHQIFSDAFGVKFEREERQKWLAQRQSGKATRRTFINAIRDYVKRHPEHPPMDSKFIYANASDYVNLRVMGRRSKQLKEDFELSDSGSVRDIMSIKELSRVEMIEDEATIQVDKFDIHPCEAVRRVSDVLLFAPSDRGLV